MIKKQLTKMDYIKNTCYIILSLATLGGVAFGIERYFAKTSQVKIAVQQIEEAHKDLTETDESIAERVDLNISDDRIYEQQQQIRRIKDLTRIVLDPNPRKLTEAEKEVIQEKEAVLKRLEKEREEKLKFYRNRREQRKR